MEIIKLPFLRLLILLNFLLCCAFFGHFLAQQKELLVNQRVRNQIEYQAIDKESSPPLKKSQETITEYRNTIMCANSARRSCADLDEITSDGTWNMRSGKWVTKNCCYDGFEAIDSEEWKKNNGNSALNEIQRQQSMEKTSNEDTLERFSKCISGKVFGFYGDSTLNLISKTFLQLETPGNKVEVFSKPQPPSYRKAGGFIGGNTSTVSDNSTMNYQRLPVRVDTWWANSAYKVDQRPHTFPSFEMDDYSIISISIWDMRNYYKGVNKWYNAMKNTLMQAVKKRRQSSNKGKPIYVMHIHKLHADKCKLINDTPRGRLNYKLCRLCFTDSALDAFREALEAAVRCVQSKGYQNDLRLVDTYGITNNTYAKNESDGVHYGRNVMKMELNFLLLSICNDMHQSKHSWFNTTSLTNQIVCPKTPSFEIGRDMTCPEQNKRPQKSRVK